MQEIEGKTVKNMLIVNFKMKTKFKKFIVVNEKK